jgi:D-glycero-D-manno-heptose 1,7-bisphosphate phosphatase
MFPAIFLDRDGVLIENRSDYIRDWSQVVVFSEAIQALASPMIKNYKIAIVTNQSAVGRELVSADAVHQINDRLANIIHDAGGQLDGIYTCPHKPEDECACRKPKPGLLLRAAAELNLDLHRSWMIGDAWSDLLAGHNAGVQRLAILRTGRGSDQLLHPPPENMGDYLVFNDLSEALRAIQRLDGA